MVRQASKRASAEEAASDPAEKTYRVENVSRAIDILEAFSRERPQLSLAELAELTKIPKPSLFRIAWTLCERNLLVQNARTGFYSLGHGLLSLSYARASHQDFRAKTLPVMYRIRDALNETVVFSIRNGRRRVNVDYVEAARSVGRLPQPGFDVPLHAGASSRAVLAAMSDRDLQAYLDSNELEALTGNTIVDKQRLLRQVQRIRLKGYAMAIGEVTEGSVSIAAPVTGENGEVFGSIYVLFPKARNTREHRYRCISEIVAGAREISLAMRFS